MVRFFLNFFAWFALLSFRKFYNTLFKFQAGTTVRNFINKYGTVSTLPRVLSTASTLQTTGHLQNVASKILAQMDHSADACEDFYQYSCGGFIVDNGQEDAWERIRRQLDIVEGFSLYKDMFGDFYKSCVNYENGFNYKERINTSKLYPMDTF